VQTARTATKPSSFKARERGRRRHEVRRSIQFALRERRSNILGGIDGADDQPEQAGSKPDNVPLRTRDAAERRSRYLLVLHLPDGAGTDSVIAALTAAVHHTAADPAPVGDLGPGDRHDTPPDVHPHTKMPVFFCDARSPWQRGSNENTDGLLWQYLPKDTDLSVHSAADLNTSAKELNNRPPTYLDWQTPNEVLIASGRDDRLRAPC
jgi:hypothetical protein